MANRLIRVCSIVRINLIQIVNKNISITTLRKLAILYRNKNLAN